MISEGATLDEVGVRETPGFAEAYRQYVEGGWAALPFDEEYGGQGMPKLIGTAAEEVWQSANLSFSLCPLLTHGAVDALEQHGSDELKATLPAEDDQRRVDRHDEPDRAAGRLGPGGRGHAARFPKAIITWSPGRKSSSPGAITR